MTREEILAAAKQCVCGGRETDYGTPEDSFGLIGQYWTVYTGHMITAKDVAMMMALLKIARIQGNRATGIVSLTLPDMPPAAGNWREYERLGANRHRAVESGIGYEPAAF